MPKGSARGAVFFGAFGADADAATEGAIEAAADAAPAGESGVAVVFTAAGGAGGSGGAGGAAGAMTFVTAGPGAIAGLRLERLRAMIAPSTAVAVHAITSVATERRGRPNIAPAAVPPHAPDADRAGGGR
jgi:hypothetical protein